MKKATIILLLVVFILSFTGCSKGYKLKRNGDIIAPDGTRYVPYDHPGFCRFRENGDFLFSYKDEYDCDLNIYTVKDNPDYLTVQIESFIKPNKTIIIYESIPLYHKEDVVVPTAMDLDKAIAIYYSDEMLLDWEKSIVENKCYVFSDEAKEFGRVLADGKLAGEWEDEYPSDHNFVGMMVVVYEGAESLYFMYYLYYSEKYGIVFWGEDNSIFGAPVEHFEKIGLNIIDK